MSVVLNSERATNKDDLVGRGQRFYNEQLKALLEPEHTGRFVAIEPDTEKYFLSDTAIDALDAGRAEMPDKLFYLVRVGYRTAHKLGGHAFRVR